MSEHKTDPSELRYPTVPPTLPEGVYAVPAEVLQHLIDGQLAIHEELRSLKFNLHQWQQNVVEEIKNGKPFHSLPFT